MLSAFDLDHTLLKKNSSVAFFLYLTHRKILSYTSCMRCLFYYVQHNYFGLSLEQLHKKIFSQFLHKKKISEVMDHVGPFWDQYADSLAYFPAWSALKREQHLGAYTMIASASPDFLVAEIARRWGVDTWLASTYSVDKEGCFCQIAVVQGEDKACFLEKVCKEIGLSTKETVAYSDSHLDLPFLRSAGAQIVVNPDRILRKMAQKNSWRNI
jgi:HAD superfamily hydrolase (TIGR01490 family)